MKRTAPIPTPSVNTHRFRVGVRFPEWATGFGFRLFEGLLDFQRNRAQLELHFDQPSGGDLLAAPIDRNWNGDGLIVFRYTREEAAAWRSRGIQVVNLSAEFPGDQPDFPSITVDNRIVGKMAVEHLESLGLRNFAYIHESTRRYSSERLQAFRKAVKACGGYYHQIDVPASSFDVSERPQRIENLMLNGLSSLPRPCGILAKDDIAAVWTLKAMLKLGIRCPDEMPLLGVTDDIVFCYTTDPPLSSIPYPAREIGFEAAELLGQMMRGEPVKPTHRVMIPPVPVAARESTRRVVLADDVVTRAMEIIRSEGIHKPVHVSTLSRMVGVSRESLRQRFQATLGRSPKEEIERIRSQNLCEKLRWTELPLEVIAEENGFAGPAEICRFIKRMTGKTPGAIRREQKQ